MKHKLSLHIPDTMDDWSITIQDTSVYTELIPISCPTLQILAPGFIKAVTFNEDTLPTPLVPRFNRTFTACNLLLQTESCGSRYDCLPDGIYVIRYSVSPNDIVFVEYNHLRMVQTLKKWNDKMCELDLAPCDPPETKKAILAELMEILGYLNAAKNAVDNCHKAERGMELFNYATKRLEKLNCETCI
jgi:hypothetical protein